MQLNFEDLEMQKWNIPTDRAQRLGTKNGVICLFVMFTLRVTVIKMSKNGSFFNFLLMTAENSFSPIENAEFRYYLLTWQFFNFFKGNPNFQGILNWIIQILHYYCRKHVQYVTTCSSVYICIYMKKRESVTTIKMVVFTYSIFIHFICVNFYK